MKLHGQKEIIIFDLDKTLAKSKSNIDSEMSVLLCELLKIKKVAIISGGSYVQIKKSVLVKLGCEEFLLYNLFILPTSGTSFYRYIEGEWKSIYIEELDNVQRKTIIDELKNSLAEVGYKEPDKIYGQIIEDRGTQITFSGLGQDAPLEKKLQWDPDKSLRNKIIKVFEKKVTGFDAKIGGSTSIDINKKGIDKAYGVKQIKKELDIPIENMLFIGDTLFVDGNDFSVLKTGVDTKLVKDPEETKDYIRGIIKNSL